MGEREGRWERGRGDGREGKYGYLRFLIQLSAVFVHVVFPKHDRLLLDNLYCCIIHVLCSINTLLFQYKITQPNDPITLPIPVQYSTVQYSTVPVVLV